MTKPPLTDRERILTTLVSQLASTQLLAHRGDGYHSASYNDASIGPHVHFAYDQKPVAGDLVVGKTGGVSQWKVGWFIEPLGDSLGGALIREIGSQRTCRYSNEDFVPIRGLDLTQLLEGDQYLFRAKVVKAFARGDEYGYRYGGLRFEGDDAFITVREVFGGLNNPSVPFEVKTTWRGRVSVKVILAAMRAQGYGTKSFRPEHPKVEATPKVEPKAATLQIVLDTTDRPPLMTNPLTALWSRAP